MSARERKLDARGRDGFFNEQVQVVERLQAEAVEPYGICVAMSWDVFIIQVGFGDCVGLYFHPWRV